jgi:hypothetical protein
MILTFSEFMNSQKNKKYFEKLKSTDTVKNILALDRKFCLLETALY